MGMMQQLVNQTREDLCPPDITLRISMEKIGILSVDAGRAAVEAGYRATQEHIETLRLLTKPLPAPWLQKMQQLRRRLGLAWRIVRNGDAPLYPAP